MHRVDHATAAADLFGAGKDGYSEGEPGLAVPATRVPADHLNAVQEELVAPIEVVGLSLVKTRNRQLLDAMLIVGRLQASMRWTPHASSPMAFSVYAASCLDGATFLICGQGGAIWRSPGGLFGVVDTFEADVSPVAEDLYGLCAFVPTIGAAQLCVGANGTILRYDTGISEWVSAVSPSLEALRGVTIGRVGGVLRRVIVGESGTILYAASNSGPWVPATLPLGFTSNLLCVTWRPNSYDGGSSDDGVFVAGGVGGALLRSVDGVTWTAVSSGHGYDILAIRGGQVFCTAGAFSIVSRDGVTWVGGGAAIMTNEVAVDFDCWGAADFALSGWRYAASPWLKVGLDMAAAMLEPVESLVNYAVVSSGENLSAVACGIDRYLAVSQLGNLYVSDRVAR